RAAAGVGGDARPPAPAHGRPRRTAGPAHRPPARRPRCAALPRRAAPPPARSARPGRLRRTERSPPIYTSRVKTRRAVFWRARPRASPRLWPPGRCLRETVHVPRKGDDDDSTDLVRDGPVARRLSRRADLAGRRRL